MQKVLTKDAKSVHLKSKVDYTSKYITKVNGPDPQVTILKSNNKAIVLKICDYFVLEYCKVIQQDFANLLDICALMYILQLQLCIHYTMLIKDAKNAHQDAKKC